MTTRRLIVLGLLGVTVLLAVPVVASAQWCGGAWDAKLGTNLAVCPYVNPVPLYQRLGRREGIALVSGDFVALMAADPRVNARFKGLQPAAVERLKSHLADQICEATGGPCAYLGRDMKTTHKGMRITEAEWNAGIENLNRALDKHNVPPGEKLELLGKLAPMKPDIVGQ